MTDIKEVATRAILAVYTESDRLRARVAQLEALQAGPDLWCVEMPELGEVLAMRSRESAEQYAAELNEVMGAGKAAVIRSPWPQDIHAANAFAVLDAWLVQSNRTLTAQQIQIGRMRMQIAALKRPSDR